MKDIEFKINLKNVLNSISASLISILVVFLLVIIRQISGEKINTNTLVYVMLGFNFIPIYLFFEYSIYYFINKLIISNNEFAVYFFKSKKSCKKEDIKEIIQYGTYSKFNNINLISLPWDSFYIYKIVFLDKKSIFLTSLVTNDKKMPLIVNKREITFVPSILLCN